MSDDLWDGAEAVTVTEAVRRLEAALRESQAREAALLQMLKVLTDWAENEQGHLSRLAARTPGLVPPGAAEVAIVTLARAALASPSAAAAKLLERVAKLEASLELVQAAAPVIQADALRAVEADRDRWLGHCRLLLERCEWLTRKFHRHPTMDELHSGVQAAARRDLEQHDGEGR